MFPYDRLKNYILVLLLALTSTGFLIYSRVTAWLQAPGSQSQLAKLRDKPGFKMFRMQLAAVLLSVASAPWLIFFLVSFRGSERSALGAPGDVPASAHWGVGGDLWACTADRTRTAKLWGPLTYLITYLPPITIYKK